MCGEVTSQLVDDGFIDFVFKIVIDYWLFHYLCPVNLLLFVEVIMICILNCLMCGACNLCQQAKIDYLIYFFVHLIISVIMQTSITDTWNRNRNI